MHHHHHHMHPTPTPTVTPQPTSGFYVDPTTQGYRAWQAASGTDKALLEKIALTPQAYWVGNWADASHAQAEVADYTGRAVAAGKTPMLVVYAIPGRDCGSHSGGGVSESEYARWVDTVAQGIKGNPIVILEPDALAQLGDCSGQGDRVGFLKYAAKSLTLKGARVYIDAGHAKWLSVDTAVNRLNQVGFEYAVGFALNTSNYQTTADSKAYGQQISQRLGGKKFVIDTSRNGNGSNGEWCNPRGRALGERPVAVNDGSGLDALLWVKLPGESDGACNGGPAAGQWWQEIALEMARNARWGLKGSGSGMVLLGDVNGDGTINSTDLTMLKRSVLRAITLTDDAKARADVDKNGSINSTDVLLLSRYLLRVIGSG
nr:endoglucanase/dockerin fusion protein [synthetic construct]